MDAQWKRINAVCGENEEAAFEGKFAAYYNHLIQNLELPCDVTGIEDFQWEERYVLGAGDPAEYERLKKVRPSYRDHFELLKLERNGRSEWMLFHGDIGARVRRKSDGKEFLLGLAELKAVKRKTRNAQLLDDFSVFFVNSR